jgi:hypothetical protein
MNECIQMSKEKKRKYTWLGVWEKNEKRSVFMNVLDLKNSHS